MIDMDTFIFPDDLDVLTRERLNLPDIPDSWRNETDCFATRVSDINFRKPGQMTFCLDGRKSGICDLTDHESGWLDMGLVTPAQLASHYAASRYTRFSRQAVQKTLFD